MKKLIAASIALVSLSANAQLMPISGSLLARAEAPAALANFVGVAAPVHAALNAAIVVPQRLNSLKTLEGVNAGDVKVSFTIDTNGVPQNIKLERSLGAQTDAAVIKAVSELRYTAGTLHGEKIAFPASILLNIK